MILFFGGEYLFVDGCQRCDFLWRKHLVVMFDELLQFPGVEPFSFAPGADLDGHAVIFNWVKHGTASWTFHRCSPISTDPPQAQGKVPAEANEGNEVKGGKPRCQGKATGPLHWRCGLVCATQMAQSVLNLNVYHG